MSDNRPEQPYQPAYQPYYYPDMPEQQQPGKNEGRSFKQKVLAGGVVACLASALLGGIVGGTAVNLADGNNNSPVSTSSNVTQTVSEVSTSDLSETINKALPSVVTVGVVSDQAAGSGSGVVISQDGYIVTNAHVATLEGATDSGTITVQTSEGKTYDAELVGYDSTADLAVLKISDTAEGITPIKFASSSKAEVGSTTIAIGSPLGLSGTVTTGIVSALDRPIVVTSSQVDGRSSNSQNPDTIALSAIQTDAAINSGNSGGALLDGNGNLVGVNVAIASTTNTSGSIGIGYAIPSDYVKRITNEIIKNGEGTHGSLGVTVNDYAENATSFSTGAQIQEVANGSAADEAGLQSGDVVLKVDDSVISSATQLTAVIKQDAPGTSVAVSYSRDGSTQTASVVLG